MWELRELPLCGLDGSEELTADSVFSLSAFKTVCGRHDDKTDAACPMVASICRLNTAAVFNMSPKSCHKIRREDGSSRNEGGGGGESS